MHTEPVRPHRLNRREFLGSTAAGLSLLPGVVRTMGAEVKSEPLTAAIIGHTGRGDYGHGWEGIFQDRAGIRTVALADPDPGGRAKTAQRIGVNRTYADYREMLSREKPKLVSVAMRHADQHQAIVMSCLEAGAHVWCEKPFTTTPAEADTLLGEASRRGLKIAVAHTTRMSPMIMRLKKALDEGFLGELVEMRAYGKQDSRAGGEDMMVLGTHLFDLMRLLAGDPQYCSARVLWKGRELRAGDGRRVKDDVGLVGGDTVFAQFAFSNGVTGRFTSRAALRQTIANWGIELLGSKGSARINCDLAPTVFVRESSAWSTQGKQDNWRPFKDVIGGEIPGNSGPVGDWLEAVRQDREPECSGRNGAWAVEMATGVYVSALSGGRASFPLSLRGHPLSGSMG